MRRAALWLVLLAACRCEQKVEAPASAAPDAVATSTQALVITPGKVERAAEEVADPSGRKPVYRGEGAPDSALAKKLCAALYSVPLANEARCCQREPSAELLEGQCARVISVAVHESGLALSEAAVDACDAAMRAAHADCAWIGGPWKPPVPEACQSVLRGEKKAGEKCASSLECAGDLSCRGAGVTDVGTCAPPKPEGMICGASVDQLAVYARQERLEQDKPECAGWCYKRKCTAHLAVGAECETNAACGPKARCAGGKCVKGAHGKVGEVCADGGCAEPARCINRQCVLLKEEGQACASAFECKAGCAMGEGQGRCATQCRPPGL